MISPFGTLTAYTSQRGDEAITPTLLIYAFSILVVSTPIPLSFESKSAFILSKSLESEVIIL
jgi:hypothetical protein